MSKLEQMTCENLDHDSFWSIMKNEAINAHLKQEAYKVADLIAREWDSQKNIDKQTCENFDKKSFWSIMENEIMRAHIKKEAYKVANTIAKFKLEQMTCENFDEETFWSIMKNKDMHAHLKTEAYKVVSLITRRYNQNTSDYKKNWKTPTKAVEQNVLTLTVEKDIHTEPRHEAFNVMEVISVSTSYQDSLSRVEVQSPAVLSNPQLSSTSASLSPLTNAKLSQMSVMSPPKTDEDKKQLQSFFCPKKSLYQIFKLLSSDDWEKKIDGLTSIQDLARSRPGVLKTTLHNICIAVIKEVKNLRSLVSCTAMATLREMYAHLQSTMDEMVEEIGRVLLLKASESNAFIQQQANLTLNTLVENCSPGRTMHMLLNAGLSHRSAAARTSAAQHLSQLYNILGATRTLTGAKKFTKCFLIAVSKLCVDAAPDVRHHGYYIVQDMCTHSAFQMQWKEAVPERDRRSLEGLMRKLNTAKRACSKGL